MKDVRRRYRPARTGWEKVRGRATANAGVAGVLGTLCDPHALLLGQPGVDGRLRVAGRTGPLPEVARRELGALLVPPRSRHPCQR